MLPFQLYKLCPVAAGIAMLFGAAFPVAHAQDSNTANSSALTLEVEREEYTPLANHIWQGMYFALPLTLGAFAESSSEFGVDRYGELSGNANSVQPLLRLGAKFSTLKKFKAFRLQAEIEHDLLSGFAGQALAMDDEGFVEDAPLSSELRKAYAVLSIKDRLWLGGGVMTSSWGLGLVANGGDQQWQPGSARFVSPRGGDRVIRAFAVIGLHPSSGTALRFGADKVLGDDVLLKEKDRLRGHLDSIEEDDKAHQFLVAVTTGEGKKYSGGIYAAYRNQSAVSGEETKVMVVDLHAKTEVDMDGHVLELEGELAWISGDTEWAPTMDYKTHKINQLGTAVRASYRHSDEVGAVLDFLYASGDQNFDDEVQTAFKADRNYEMGMLLYRQVLARQSARAVGTASNLELVGEPSDDIERFATRGSASNTISFFPRGYIRPRKGLEVYGGPLFAFTAVSYADPLNSRLSGGTPRNAKNAKPGNYLGMELDVGVRYRRFVAGAELTVGLEGGMLMPGAVFDDAMGLGLGAVFGARALLDIRL